jgi:hypothetical protein
MVTPAVAMRGDVVWARDASSWASSRVLSPDLDMRAGGYVETGASIASPRAAIWQRITKKAMRASQPAEIRMRSIASV